MLRILFKLNYDHAKIWAVLRFWCSIILSILSIAFSQTDAIPDDAFPITTLPSTPSISLPADSFTLLSESGLRTCEQAALMFVPSEGYVIEAVDCVFYPVRTGQEMQEIQNNVLALGYELYAEESDGEATLQMYLNRDNYNYMLVTIPDPQPNDGANITMLLVYKNIIPTG